MSKKAQAGVLPPQAAKAVLPSHRPLPKKTALEGDAWTQAFQAWLNDPGHKSAGPPITPEMARRENLYGDDE